MSEPIQSEELTPTTEQETSESPVSTEGGESAPDAFTAGWADVLEQLPEVVRPLVEPALKEHDRKYQELQTNWNQVKDLPPEWRNSERLQQAIGVVQNIQNNPGFVLQKLAENLGVTIQQAEQMVEEEAEREVEREAAAPLEFSDDDDPRLKALYQHNQQLESQVTEIVQRQMQLEQDKLRDYELEKIDNQVDGWVKSGAIPSDPRDSSVQDFYIKDLMIRAKVFMDQGAPDPMLEALRSQQEFSKYNQARAQATQSGPPSQNLLFMPTGGAAPPNNPQPPDLSTEDGRLAMMRSIAGAAAKQ